MAENGIYPEMTEFMEAAMRRVGVSTIPELCEITKLNTARNTRDFYKWLRGQHRPLLPNALPLMRATGMLNEAKSHAARGPTAAAALREAIGAIQASEQVLLDLLDQLDGPPSESEEAAGP